MDTVQQKKRLACLWIHESKSTVTVQRMNRLCKTQSKNFIKRWLIIHDSSTPLNSNSCRSKPTINVNILAELACLFFQQVPISITAFGFPAISAGGTRGAWLTEEVGEGGHKIAG
ncbi:hypothetical protein AVEN_250693-1 [Araneus ventricosus]|uniref:DUF4817 domain-containing protein n=1 Tax=Araneus ventricosus TaxID=182803 RepID=A0A4Y2U4F7_ARAVE|nr:hypothetical protein AVEN_250693-1 [Araneus ventricosus]